MHHITNIEKIEPYKVYCIFDNTELRCIDFSPILNETTSLYIGKLKDKNIFSEVKLDRISKTLFWEGLAQIRDYDGIVKSCELDFDPTVLYHLSVKV